MSLAYKRFRFVPISACEIAELCPVAFPHGTPLTVAFLYLTLLFALEKTGKETAFDSLSSKPGIPTPI